MADSIFDVDWSQAERLLRKRDRYTAELVQSEFSGDPLKQGAIEIDAARRRYVTPVVGDRYVVMWDLEERPAGKLAIVRAVVPTQLASDDPDQVRAQVENVIEYESRSKVG